MPRIGGINVVGVLLATIAFYIVGFVFYGLLFSADWTAHTLAAAGVAELDSIRQMSPERLQTAWAEAFPSSNQGVSLGLGFVNATVTTITLAIVLRFLTSDAPSLFANIGFAFLIAIGFGVTTLCYDVIYASAPMPIFWIDTLHLIIAYMVASIVLFFLD